MKWLKLKLTGKNRLVVALIFVALVVGAGLAFRGQRTSAAQYLTTKVERGNLRNTVTATGTLQAVTTVQVGSQASGTISALYADFNLKVKNGQVIAQLDPATTEAQVQQSRASLEQARASLAQARAGMSDAQAKALAAGSAVQNEQAGVSSAQSNLAVLKAQRDDALSFLRQQEALLRGGIIAQRDYDTAETSYKAAAARNDQAAAQLNQAVVSQQSASSAGLAQSQAQVQQSKAQVQQAEAQIQQAQAALRLAEINLTHTTIRSPIDGIIVSRDVDVGQTVAASLSAPTLFTIAKDLTQMQVIANIDQADIGLVQQAKGVQFTVDAFPGDEFTGSIQQIRLNAQNVQNVVTYNVVINVSNPDEKLKPGMTTDLTFTIDERNSVLKVPNAGLRFLPPDANRQRNSDQSGGIGQGFNQGRRQGARQTANAGGNAAQNTAQSNEQRGGNFAPPTAPVLKGQERVIWVLGQDDKPQPRRIKIGLTDGTATEVVEGNLQEGELIITGENISSEGQSRQTVPGFGGTPRGMGIGGVRRG
jgi:HlyD family secretion protein